MERSTTSGLALTPLPRWPNYSASKAALHHFILCLRDQLRNSQVKVIELLPPLVQSTFHLIQSSDISPTDIDAAELHDPKNQPELNSKGPMGMPLDAFVAEAYAGLSEGKEQVPVGTAKGGFVEGGFETLRQGVTSRLMDAMRPK